MVFLHLKRLFRLSLMVPNSCLEGITYFVKNNISPGEIPCIVWSGEWPEGVDIFVWSGEWPERVDIFVWSGEWPEGFAIFVWSGEWRE